MRTLIALLLLPMCVQAAPPVFIDVTKDSGLKIAPNTGVGGTNPHAIAVSDFDGDGLSDVILLTFGKPHVYYFKNLGNLKFADATKGGGLETFEGEGTGIAVADFDRDGHLDVYCTSLRKGASRLYRGTGKGTFIDVSERAGVLVKGAARSVAWSDIDGDGFVDLYVTRPDGANLLFRNNKDGTFTDIAKDAGVQLADRHSLGCAFADIDGDGKDDLVVTNYESQVSALFKNLGGGKFRDITKDAGLDRRCSAVGCTFGDVFNRGRLDLYISTDSWLAGANYTEAELLKQKKTVEPNVLYTNDGKGKFTPFAEPLFAHKSLGHDIVIEDFDHDGLPDIYVGVDAESGNKWATSKGGNPLWARDVKDAWREVSKEWGAKIEANCVCVPAADLDNDGDLDLILVNFYTQPAILRNETNDKNWLRVTATGKASSRDGIGAKVSAFAEVAPASKIVAFRQIHSGAGYCRCSPLESHIGLGKTPAVSYRVEVTFPSGKVVVKEKVKPGTRVNVEE